MKKTNFKKALSVFLSVLMIMSCWVFVPGEHNRVSAASKTINLSALAAISNGGGSRADSNKIVICSDGEEVNTTVGNARFPISSLPNMVTSATLYVSTGNHNGTLANSSVKFYMIDPAKCQATSVGHAVNNIASVYGSNYNAQQGVTNAYNYYGISESQALGSTLYQNAPGSYNFDITNAVNQAKANGWSDLCLAFIMPQIYNDGNGNTWSDFHINTSGTYLQVEYEGAYGMPQASISDNTGEMTIGWASAGSEDKIVVTWPEEIYMDKSETLQDTGYGIGLSEYHFGDSDRYTIILYSPLWGGVDSDYNWGKDCSNPASMSTQMLDIFSGYGIESTVGSGRKDRQDTLFVWADTHPYPTTDTLLLQGTPTTTGEYTYSTTTITGTTSVKVATVNKSGWGGYTYNSYFNGDDAHLTGDKDVTMKVTIYDKEALNQTYQKSVQIYNINAPYGDYITEGLDTYLAYHNTTTPNLLKTRKTNQTAINNEKAGLENAIKGLVFNANNSALVAAMNSAKAIIDEADYTTKYTAASRSALETAYNNAVNSVYDTSVPKYQITNLGDSSTWNVGEKAANDQIAINNLTNAINAVDMAFQTYTVTFNYVNGSSLPWNYNYGATISAPVNTTKDPDETNHYTYTWSPAVSTTVTGDATYTEVLETEAHIWGSWSTALEADCKTEGIERRSCTVCGYTEEQNVGVNSNVHNNTTTVAKTDATCTTDGYTEGVWCYNCETWISGHTVIPAAHTPGPAATCEAPQTCTVCGEVLAAQLAHTEEVIPAVAATCTKTGLTEGKKCSVCGEILLAQQETPMAAHTEELVPGKAATCTETGLTDGKKCSVCGTILVAQETTPTIDHNLGDWITDKEPTCVTPGSKHKKCANCDYETTAEAIPATGVHNYTEFVETVAPTCTDKGYDIYKCATCDAKENKNYKDAAHTIAQGEAKEPTCGAAGWEAYEYCTKCDYTTKVEIPATGNHVYNYVQNADGKTHTGTCSCGATVEGTCSGGTATCENAAACTTCNTAYGEALGHDMQKTAEKVEPKCEVAGKEAVYTCANGCGKTTGGEEIEALKHDMKKTADEIPAECEKPGKTEVYTCANGCGKTTGGEEIPALVHNWVKGATTDPTCTAQGYTTYTCSLCSSSKSDDFVDELGHDWADATCTAPKTCSVCGEIEGEALGHTYGETWTPSTENGKHYRDCTRCGEAGRETVACTAGEAVEENRVEASCGADGSYDLVTYCTVCNAELSRDNNTIPATGKHNYVTEVEGTRVPATCETEGEVTFKCGCGATQVQTLPIDANNHKKLVTDAAVDATCYSTGLTEGKHCEACGVVTVKQTVIEKKAHTPAEAVEENRKESSCTVAGSYDSVVYCSVCNEKLSSETVELPLAEHTEGEAVEENIKESTCTVAGSYDLVVYCSKCNAELNRDTIDLPLAEHNWGNATCDAPATCTVCGTTTGGILGHDYTVYVETIDYTCTTDGYDIYKCSRCDEITHKNLTAAAHTLTQVEAKEPTCGAPGWEAYEYCSKCDYTTKIEKPATGNHIYDYAQNADGETHTGTCTCGSTTSEACSGGTATCVAKAICEKCETAWGEKDADNHTGTANVVKGKVDATCTATGYTGDIHWSCCDALETKGTTTAINADAHTSTETYVDGYVAPTCTTEGATGDTKYKCCNAVKVASTVISVDADAHTGTANVIKNKADATCTAEGYTGDTYWSCCDALETKGTTTAINADAHTSTETYVDGYVAPTCTTEGATGDTKYKCCNAVKVASAVISVNADAHTGTANVVKNKKDATCTAEGYTGDIHWSCCDALETKGTAIPMILHKDDDNDNLCDYGCGTEFETNCDHEGTTKQYITNIMDDNKQNTHSVKCVDCGEIIKTEKCEFKTETVAATCCTDGYTVYTCKLCGYSFKADIVAADEDLHKFGRWYDNEASCKEIRTQTRYCDNPGCFVTETVTVFENGKPAYGAHYYVVVPGRDATCTTDGHTPYYRCVTCDEVTEPERLPAKGHTDGDKNGNCDRCGYIINHQGRCKCFCHNDAFFVRIFFKIVNFFWKLFKINANCECGSVHW